MKLYEAVIREYVGQSEWTHHELVFARTLKSAEKKAHDYARKFWASWEDRPAKKNEEGQYEFAGGEIVEVMYVKETTREEFSDEAFYRAMIN